MPAAAGDPFGIAANPRVFDSGVPASYQAAGSWSGISLNQSNSSLRSLLFEDGDCRRVWWSGSTEELLSRAAEAEDPGSLRAAIRNYDRRLEAPGRVLVMGILNVTPDSFSDGGKWLDVGAAVQHGLRMISDGADLLDIGGESTRPGADLVPSGEELRRVLPVVERLKREAPSVILSIDTRKSAVAKPCLDAGADWINDVSGLAFDPILASTVALFPDARLVLMHSRADPQQERYSTEWAGQETPEYDDVVADVMRDLRRRCAKAVQLGVGESQLWIDPGFGFGKTFHQNVELLRRLREFTSIGLPILVGTSRKSTLGRLAGGLPPEDRLEATAATVAACVLRGAAAVRVHDVKEMARVVRVAEQL